MTSFIEALQGFDFTQAAASQNVNISVGNGNNTITVIGDNANITAGDGNNEIEAQGDDDSILVGDGNNKITTAGARTKITAGDINDANSKGNNDIYQVGTNAQIMVANGDNKVISYSNNATILGGNGDNLVGSLGNNVKIGMGNGDNTIGFWGDNDVINVGNGNNNIKTLDWVKGGPQAADDISKAHNQEIRDLMGGNSLGKLATDKDIQDMAANVWSSFKTGSKTETQVTGSRTSTSSSSWTSGNRLYTTTTRTTVTDYLNTYINYLNVTGVKNPTVKYGTGNNDIGLTVSGGSAVVAKYPNQIGDNKITVLKGGYQHYTSATQKATSSTSTTSSTSSTVIRRSYDPLVIDFNQDGKVSASAGQGIDLDGDGIADGAATNGDKMLAMSDLNGNGQIDGAEIFGDTTVDPFTKQKLNAKNGFQALELLAKSAEQHTSVKNIIDSEGNVDLAKLKEALATVGVNLGFVSDANNSKLEELSKVAKINVKNYSESGETEGTVHHAQQGTYVDENGQTYKVHDVWFHQL